MLGLPNFASPLLLPTLQPLTTSHETQQQISTIGNAPRPAISAASPPATVSTTNGAVPTSTHQQSSPFISGYIGSQHEHLAAALSLAQQLRAQHFAPHTAPAPLQPNVVQPTSLMSVHAAVPTSQASVPLAHAATPIDLSTTPAPNTPTSNDERLQVCRWFINVIWELFRWYLIINIVVACCGKWSCFWFTSLFQVFCFA